MQLLDWRKHLVEKVVPEGEGIGHPLSVRYPEKLLARIDACAEETGNSRTDAILHLLRWALDRYEATKTQPKKSA